MTLAGRDGHEMTGCVLASIFTGMAPEVRVTLGALSGADALEHYRFLDQLGPAFLSQGAIFLYGPPGTGKTSLAERMNHFFGKDSPR